MTREDIQAFTVRFVESWQRGDGRALAANYTDTASVESPLFGKRRGRDEIEASYRDLFRVFAGWRITIDATLVDPNGARALLLTTSRATHVGEMFGYPASNRQFTLNAAFLFEFDKGRIASEVRLYDFTGLLVELGVLTAKKR